MTDHDPENAAPSKSQKKREMAELRNLAAKLVDLPHQQIERIPYTDIVESIEAAKKITKGNAKKRQIQFIAKQLSKVELQPVTDIVDRLDASSAAYVRQFHRLEALREALMTNGRNALDEICVEYPQTDRQHLRQLIRNAISEREAGRGQTHFRKLFQYLKRLSDNT